MHHLPHRRVLQQQGFQPNRLTVLVAQCVSSLGPPWGQSAEVLDQHQVAAGLIELGIENPTAVGRNRQTE
jgi:hypothetical protein